MFTCVRGSPERPPSAGRRLPCAASPEWHMVTLTIDSLLNLSPKQPKMPPRVQRGSSIIVQSLPETQVDKSSLKLCHGIEEFSTLIKHIVPHGKNINFLKVHPKEETPEVYWSLISGSGEIEESTLNQIGQSFDRKMPPQRYNYRALFMIGL